MPIYHTPTRKAYNALMGDLEKQGYLWTSGALPTDRRNWEANRKETCINVNVSDKSITFDLKGWYEYLPNLYGEIILYVPEKEETEDTAGCDVCLKGKPMVPHANASTKLTIEDGELEVEHFDDDYGEQSDYLNINYCPMCGTKLKEGELNE